MTQDQKDYVNRFRRRDGTLPEIIPFDRDSRYWLDESILPELRMIYLCACRLRNTERAWANAICRNHQFIDYNDYQEHCYFYRDILHHSYAYER